MFESNIWTVETSPEGYTYVFSIRSLDMNVCGAPGGITPYTPPGGARDPGGGELPSSLTASSLLTVSTKGSVVAALPTGAELRRRPICSYALRELVDFLSPF